MLFLLYEIYPSLKNQTFVLAAVGIFTIVWKEVCLLCGKHYKRTFSKK